MTDTGASVPPSDDPKPSTAEPEAKAEGDDDTQGYGWDAEFDKTAFADDDIPSDVLGEGDEADETTSDDNNSPPTPTETPSSGQTADPAPPPSARPPVPEGFASWEDALAAVKAATRAPAPQAAPPSRLPSLPHDEDNLVRELADALIATPPEHKASVLSRAPAELQNKAIQRLDAVDKAVTRFRNDPIGFARDIAARTAEEVMENSPFAARFRWVERQLQQQVGEKFFTEKKLVGEDRTAFASLVKRGVDPDLASQIVAERKELARLKGTEGKVGEKQRQIDAQKNNARAQQDGKGRGRAPDLEKAKRVELKAAGTDVIKIAAVHEKYDRLQN